MKAITLAILANVFSAEGRWHAEKGIPSHAVIHAFAAFVTMATALVLIVME